MVFSGFGQTGFSIYQNPLKSHPPHGSFLVFILCPVTIHLFVCISGNKVISEPNTYFPICFSRMGVWGKPLFWHKRAVSPSITPYPLIPLRLTPDMMYLRRNTNTRNSGALTRATAAI